MKNAEAMTGAEIRDVYGNKEAFELEQQATQLSEDIEFIKSKMDEEWDEGLKDQLRDVLDKLREVNKDIRAIKERYTRINAEARPVE